MTRSRTRRATARTLPLACLTVAATAAVAGAAITNGTFETGLAGWAPGYPANTALTLGTGNAHTGNGYAVISHPPGPAPEYSLQNLDPQGPQDPSWTYTASAWVRGNASSNGKSVVLRIRERDPVTGEVVAETSSKEDVTNKPPGADDYPKLSLGWRQLVVSTQIQRRCDTIDVYLVQLGPLPGTPAAVGEAVDVDDVSLVSPATGVVNHPPLGDFTYQPANPVVGQQVTLTDTSTETDPAPDGITPGGQGWDFNPAGDGNGSFTGARGTAVARVTFTKSGPHIVREQVADKVGGTATVVKTIMVRAKADDPVPPAPAPSAPPVCAPVPPPPPPITPPITPPTAKITIAPGPLVVGVPITFVDASTPAGSPIASRMWDLDNDGNFTDSTTATASRVFAAPGNYTVKLRVSDNVGPPATAAIDFQVGVTPTLTPPPIITSTPGLTPKPSAPRASTRRVRVCRYAKRNGRYVRLKNGRRKIVCRIVVKPILKRT